MPGIYDHVKQSMVLDNVRHFVSAFSDETRSLGIYIVKPFALPKTRPYLPFASNNETR